MQQRVLELLALAKQGELIADQKSELEHFTQLEHILRMAKARARQILAAQRNWCALMSLNELSKDSRFKA